MHTKIYLSTSKVKNKTTNQEAGGSSPPRYTRRLGDEIKKHDSHFTGCHAFFCPSVRGDNSVAAGIYGNFAAIHSDVQFLPLRVMLALSDSIFCLHQHVTSSVFKRRFF